MKAVLALWYKVLLFVVETADCPLSVWLDLYAISKVPSLLAWLLKKEEDLKQPMTTGYRSDNVTDLVIIQFIIILCGFKVCGGFKYQGKVTWW